MVNLKTLREEFRVKKFGLCYDKPEDFINPQFGSKKIYIVFRILWMVFNLGWIIASGCLNYNFASTEANRIKWFTFLTNWTYLLLTVHSIIMSVLVVYHQYHHTYQDLDKVESSMPGYLKCIWVFSNVVHGGSFIVTGLFWIVIFPGIKTLYVVTFVVHSFNSIYVLFNIFVSRIPVRILHCYQVMIYGAIYLFFTVLYKVAGGRGRRNEPSIYPVLNWDHPGKTSLLAVLGVFLGAPLVHLFVYILYRCRVFLAEKLQSKKRNDSKEKVPPDSFNRIELEEMK